MEQKLNIAEILKDGDMIDNKKIEDAAKQHAEETFITEYWRACYMEGFIESAKWTINEFLKDLWHPASEEPREFAEVLAEAKITESIKTYISFKRNGALFKNWNAYSSGANITRWLYIDNLFPKEGGKQ